MPFIIASSSVFTISDKFSLITVSTGSADSGVVFDNVKVTNAFRGIQFWQLSGNAVIRNSVIDVPGYTIGIDAVSADSTLTVEGTTLNGWTSFTSGIKLATFKDCKFGFNTYAYCRPYSDTVFEGCEFTDGEGASNAFKVNAGGTENIEISFKNCTHCTAESALWSN